MELNLRLSRLQVKPSARAVMDIPGHRGVRAGWGVSWKRRMDIRVRSHACAIQGEEECPGDDLVKKR